MYRIFYILLGIVSQIDCACDGPLGVSYNLQTVKDTQLSARTTANEYMAPKLGRLHQPAIGKGFGLYCAADEDKTPWFQISFNSMTAVTKVALGTNDLIMLAYVKTYTLKYSYDERIWYDVRTDNWTKPKVFQGMKNVYDISTVNIGRPVVAKYFRIYPLTKFDDFCLQTELYGCDDGRDCNHPIGIEKRSEISDEQMTSSSNIDGHQPSEGRLNNLLITPPSNWGAWCAGDNDPHPWLQIDLKTVREVSRIATQGHPSSDMSAWVMEYKLNYSMNAIDWFQYDELFTGNVNGNTKHVNELKEPFKGRYVRFLPNTWNEMACMRVELYECIPRKEFTPSIHQTIQDTTINRGEEFQLSCKFEGQPGMKVGWNRNGNFLTTDVRVTTEESISDRTITGILRFKRLKSDEDGVMFTCLAWYPRLEKIYASSSAVLSIIAPVATVDIIDVQSKSAQLEVSFTGPKTKDVIGYKLRITTHTGITFQTLTFANKTIVNKTELHPFRNYTVEAAMLYLGDEIGTYESKQKFETLQDVPSSAPLDLVITKATHDSLHCSWKLPAVDDRNGIILEYEVRYLRSVRQDEVPSDYNAPKSKYLIVNTTSVTLYQLDPGSVYEVAVRAFTVIGAGPFNHPPKIIFTGEATEELTTLREMKITAGNAAAVGNRLKNITADPNFLNKHDVVLTLDILEKVVDVQNSSELLGQSLVEAVSNVLKANKTVLAESEITNRTGTRYVKMLEKWLENVDPEEKNLEENSENVIVKKIFLQKNKLEEGIKFAEGESEIIIPKEALPKNNSGESIYFVYYKNNKFFTKKKRLEEQCIGGFTVVKERVYTPVISGDVVGQETKNLSAPVILKFKAGEDANLEESACVYWDFKANMGKGDWSTEGCTLQSIVNQTIVCHCNHLTNFAAMMDIYAQTSKICGFHQEMLTYITVIGCFMSLIGLFLTFLTYLLFRRLLREMAAKVLIQLCAALFIVIVAFVTGIEQTDKPYVCTTVAVILHYFTLVSFMWMLMEAAFMYHAFVRVWPPRERGDIMRSTAVAWAIPFVIVLITFLTNPDKYGGEQYCHVHGLPLYAGYLAPIGLIILINLIFFVCIMYRLSTRPNSNTDKTSTEIAFTRLRRAFGIMILMGLTWSFGFGSASSARLEFTYLFAICNGLQGFAIFLFYCLAQKNARLAWYRFFTCETRSERKITTDSYYERSRLSSNISNRTNTMQFRRLGSNASSVFQSPTSLPYNNSDNSMLNTIDELDSPIQTFEPDIQPDVTDQLLTKQDIVLSLDEESVDSEDDLNLRLQKEENRKSKTDLKNYSSYRALSSTTPNGAVATSATSKSLNKDLNYIKSADQLHKKKEAPNKRSSMIENPLHHTHIEPIRNVKSCDDLTSSEELPIGDENPEIGLLSYRNINSSENIDSGVALETTLSSPEPISHRSKPRSETAGTIKSDVGTMTEDSDLVRSPLHSPTRQNDPGIMNWLQDCDDVTQNGRHQKDTDSDYSSSCYKTSRSSSVAELNSPTRRTYEVNNTKKRQKDTPNKTIITPLIEHSPLNNNAKILNRQSSTSFNTDSERETADGYSASEEDMINSESHKQKNKLKRRKHRQRSVSNSTKPNTNVYVTLDNPSENHVSYV